MSPNFDKISIPTVIKILEKDQKAVTRWLHLCEILLPNDVGTKMQLLRQVNNSNGNFYEVFSALLNSWKSGVGNAGTLESFVKILLDNDFKDAADNVTREFGLIPSGNTIPEDKKLSVETKNGRTKEDATTIPKPQISRQEFPLQQVVSILTKSVVFINKWPDFFNWLRIDDPTLIVELTNGYKVQSITPCQLFTSILTTWEYQNGKAATLKMLIDILNKNKAVQIAEQLEDELLV